MHRYVGGPEQGESLKTQACRVFYTSPLGRPGLLPNCARPTRAFRGRALREQGE